MFDIFKKFKYFNFPSGKPKCVQPVDFVGKGKIECGKKVQFGYFPSPDFHNRSYIEARRKTAHIMINDNTVINNHSSIICNSTKIEIGKKCIIGINFQCYDSDFHNISAAGRMKHEPFLDMPIKIGDNVFIGNNVIILKGVTIGDNSVIGAGSVVTKSCDNNSIIAGNPAVFIKIID